MYLFGLMSLVFSVVGVFFPVGMCMGNICGIKEEFQLVARSKSVYNKETGQYEDKIIEEYEQLRDFLGPRWFLFLLLP